MVRTSDVRGKVQTVPHMRYGKSFLLGELRRLQSVHAGPVVIHVRPLDPFDWWSLGARAEARPETSHGQVADWRFATDGDGQLHGRVFHDRVAFHLDAPEACADDGVELEFRTLVIRDRRVVARA